MGATLERDGSHELSVVAFARKPAWGFSRPIEHVRAHYFLGRSREMLGDVAGACSSYAEVLRRWASARPRSVSADDARKRRAALHCESDGG
jgi:hypothetical protein